MAQLLGGNQSACLPIVVHLDPMYRNPHSIYKTQSRVPCPQGQSLMSPTVGACFFLFLSPDKQAKQTIVYFSGMKMHTWSDCTRKMIDAEYDRREGKKKNCFYTWTKEILIYLKFPKEACGRQLKCSFVFEWLSSSSTLLIYPPWHNHTTMNRLG